MASYTSLCFTVSGAYKTYSFFGGRLVSTSTLRRLRRKGRRIVWSVLMSFVCRGEELDALNEVVGSVNLSDSTVLVY